MKPFFIFASLCISALFGQTIDTNPRGLTVLPFAGLGAPADGTIVYCSNCSATNPATGGGTGFVTRRENGAWNSAAGPTGATGATGPTGPAGSSVPASSNLTPVTASAVTNSDQTLQEVGLTAGALNTVKAANLIHGSGRFTIAALQTPTLTFKAKLCTISGCGSGTVVTLASIVSGASVAATNNGWNLQLMAGTVSTGASGTLEIHGAPGLTVDIGALPGSAATVLTDTNTAVSSAIDLTAALFVDFTVATSVGAAGNTFTQDIAEVLPQGAGASAAAGSTLVRLCEIVVGDPGAASPVLADDNDSPSVCGNKTGATLTITAVECFANAGSPTVTPIITGGGATSILTGALSCGTGSFATGTLNGTPTQTTGQSIDGNITTAGGTAKYIVIRITRTL
jgi:hypothetical protein